jgi:hypothetical protein
MRAFKLVPMASKRGSYWIERVVTKPMALIHTKAKAEKVRRAFDAHLECWSCRVRNGLAVVTLELRGEPGAPYIKISSMLDEGCDADRAAGIMTGLQREAYDGLARNTIGPY